MKYYRRKYADPNNGIERFEYNYEEGEVPVNVPLWGFAYTIKNDTAHHKYFCKPVLGELRKFSHSHSEFYPYKKNGEICKSKGVSLNARYYADTYKEAVEMYNELVNNRISRLYESIKEAEKDLISVAVAN